MTSQVDQSRVDDPVLSTGLIAYLRALLLSENAEHVLRLAEHRASSEALLGHADADSLAERERLEAAADKAFESITDIQHALACIDDGSYGACRDCGRAIPFARLEAIPHARLCVQCVTADAHPLR